MNRIRSLKGRYRVKNSLPPLKMTPESIETYIAEMERRGRLPGTLEEYRRNLRLLYGFLPQDKRIRRDTLRRWRAALLEQGYSPRTANARVSAVNSYLAHYGRRDLQVIRQLEAAASPHPEMTRTEYLRLLQTARLLGKERLYLLIKLFGSTGLPVQALPHVTMEAIRQGAVPTGGGKKAQAVRLPACLREELLDYAARCGIRAGLLFVTRQGTPLSRTNVADAIRHLCRDAQVPEEKGNPRCLRRMYQDTQDGILRNVSALIDQAYQHLLENEQLSIGWAAV